MAKEQGDRGIFERFAGFAERFNKVLGGVALAGALVFESTTLAAIGVLQFVEGAVWKRLKEWRARKPKLQMAT